MTEVVSFSATVTMGFFAIMNPIGNTPIFLSLAGTLSPPAQRRIARKAVVLAFVIVAAFAIGGNLLFRAFGITLPAFRIAGGILVFMVGYHLLQGGQSAMHHPSKEPGEAPDPTDVAVSPLATPILAGPGTIATGMSFAAPQASLGHALVVVIVLIVFAIACAATYVCFVIGEKLVAWIGPGIIKVISRLMGLLLTVMAVQMVVLGVKALS
ncbi:MAG: NAAT family transporter [Phycisphaerae bacterium]|nr:NAAT family transporter [Phycisphaerae bacterium]